MRHGQKPQWSHAGGGLSPQPTICAAGTTMCRCWWCAFWFWEERLRGRMEDILFAQETVDRNKREALRRCACRRVYSTCGRIPTRNVQSAKQRDSNREFCPAFWHFI
ncbi:unnamed protein product [Toxocara canis]|uniref:Secreted protein n=1 Tax=Toxocara canis TaxID=6265 RepID=A0A183U5Q6_TOXCA|nr:unnamed protein product [Toxocara canis]